jgi:hypothetical protein
MNFSGFCVQIMKKFEHTQQRKQTRSKRLLHLNRHGHCCSAKDDEPKLVWRSVSVAVGP